jgi:hypothetical protein
MARRANDGIAQDAPAILSTIGRDVDQWRLRVAGFGNGGVIPSGRRAEPAERIPPSSRADISWRAFNSEAGHPLRGFRPTANFEIVTIRGMRPILGLIHKPMLHRVEMDVMTQPFLHKSGR